MIILKKKLISLPYRFPEELNWQDLAEHSLFFLLFFSIVMNYKFTNINIDRLMNQQQIQMPPLSPNTHTLTHNTQFCTKHTRKKPKLILRKINSEIPFIIAFSFFFYVQNVFFLYLEHSNTLKIINFSFHEKKKEKVQNIKCIFFGFVVFRRQAIYYKCSWCFCVSRILYKFFFFDFFNTNFSKRFSILYFYFFQYNFILNTMA